MNKKKIFIGIGLILIFMQFFQNDKSPISIDEKMTFATTEQPPEDVLAQMKSSCYDCHSNETKYPWYTYVAPVSFWIRGHIKNARKSLNFSTWAAMSVEDRKHALHECAEKIEIGHMPPKGYYRMHEAAYLDDTKKALVHDWLEQQSH
jgi:hypothetical protein